MKLSSIRPNQPHSITHIEESDLKNRLYEMGIYPNQTVLMVNKAPFGDPLMFEVDGHLVMLRRNEAELISIEEK